jgi:hypothetical protein
MADRARLAENRDCTYLAADSVQAIKAKLCSLLARQVHLSYIRQ